MKDLELFHALDRFAIVYSKLIKISTDTMEHPYKRKVQRKAFFSLAQSILWGIWLARNQMFFHEELPKWNLVFELIFYHFFYD
jgi:hypothetical protein